MLVGSIWLIESKTQDASTTFNSDTFCYTTAKKTIYSQGGGIFRFPDPTTGEEHYYWYGVHYKGAETYLDSPTGMNGEQTLTRIY